MTMGLRYINMSLQEMIGIDHTKIVKCDILKPLFAQSAMSILLY